MSPATRFALVFAAQFFAFGIILPFLPAVLAGRGLGAEEVAVLLAAGSAVRLVAGPLGGRVADRLAAPRLVLAFSAVLAALAAAGFLLAAGFGLLLLVMALHSAAVAPIVPLSDALAVVAARGRPGFDYARARAAGSVAFIIAVLGGGQAVAWAGPQAAVWLLMAGLAVTALAALILPPAEPMPASETRGVAAFIAPFRIPALRWLFVISALIQGSHAMYYAFGTLHWQAAGLSPGLIGALWAAGVVAEVALFWWGRGLVSRLGPMGLCLVAAAAGVLRWGVVAVTVDPWLLFPAQILHAATFGMQHLATMAVLGRAVPPAQAGMAQTLHAALGTGLWMGVFTLACGPLYAAAGGGGFWAMAALCAAAVPAVLMLGKRIK